LETFESFLGAMLEQEHNGRRCLFKGTGLTIVFEAMPILGGNGQLAGKLLGQS
jgi:hypothetical protein